MPPKCSLPGAWPNRIFKLKEKLRTAAVRGADERQRAVSACPEKVDSDFPIRTCANGRHTQDATRACQSERWTKRLFLAGFAVVVAFFLLAGENLLGDQSRILPDCGFDLRRHVRIGLEEGF
jgi:hypothetical protein